MSAQVVTKDHYAIGFALVLRQERDEGAGYRNVTTLQVRRVVPSGGEELQIEITIDNITPKQRRSSHCSFICAPEVADMLAEACKKVRE